MPEIVGTFLNVIDISLLFIDQPACIMRPIYENVKQNVPQRNGCRIPP
jgi:hypothetical protein